MGFPYSTGHLQHCFCTVTTEAVHERGTRRCEERHGHSTIVKGCNNNILFWWFVFHVSIYRIPLQNVQRHNGFVCEGLLRFPIASLRKDPERKKPSSTSKTFSCRNHLAWLTGERGVNWLTTILYVEQIALSVVIEMGRDFMMDG
jgi:hypothetical protein